MLIGYGFAWQVVKYSFDQGSYPARLTGPPNLTTKPTAISHVYAVSPAPKSTSPNPFVRSDLSASYRSFHHSFRLLHKALRKISSGTHCEHQEAMELIRSKAKDAALADPIYAVIDEDDDDVWSTDPLPMVHGGVVQNGC